MRPGLPGVILVPIRHEEAVAGQTLERLAQLDHPDYWVVPIIDHPDDPGPAAIAHEKARQHPDRVLVCPYPEETEVHNKPIGLNAAVEMLHELQIPFAWVGVADAEDLFHPGLLKLVDYRSAPPGRGSCSAACS
jgi:glycosyltransferase XagB